MDNMRIYNKYREVPKDALKPFDNGNFKGTDINTMWRIKCLTEEFGACGIGWVYDIVRTWTENGCNGEVLCFAEIKLFIKVEGEWSRGISAVGGSKLVSYIQSKQYSKNSDEGYKMAVTDALGVACKLLGFGANVYWENDKTKYTSNENVGTNAFPKNKPSTAPKTNDKTEVVKPLTRMTLLTEYDVENPEETAIALEIKFGKQLKDFTAEETKRARAMLDKKQAEREAQKRLIDDADIPFPMGD